MSFTSGSSSPLEFGDGLTVSKLWEFEEFKNLYTRRKSEYSSIMTNDEVAAYWADMERGIGEKISLYVMGTYCSGYENKPGPVLGIFFLAETALHFISFKKENWLSGLFMRKTANPNEIPLQFSVPYSSIRQIDRSAPPAVKSFFFPESPRITVTYASNPHVLDKLSLSIDMQEKEFLLRLKEKL